MQTNSEYKKYSEYLVVNRGYFKSIAKIIFTKIFYMSIYNGSHYH